LREVKTVSDWNPSSTSGSSFLQAVLKIIPTVKPVGFISKRHNFPRDGRSGPFVEGPSPDKRCVKWEKSPELLIT
jgi:hypothetical protein